MKAPKKITHSADAEPATKGELRAAVQLLTEHNKLLEIEVAKLSNSLKNVGINPVQ